MTMGSGSFAFAGEPGSPSTISLTCFKQEKQTKLMFISFSNGNGSASENSLDSGYPFASVLARCTKTTLLKTWQRRQAETVGRRHD